MATYPSFPISQESTWGTFADILTGRTADGAPRTRVMSDEVKDVFSVTHELTLSDLQTLRTFYDTNVLVESFDFVWSDGVTYACQFMGNLSIRPIGGSSRWSVSVQMEQV